MGGIYLDNNATTRVDARVVAAMLPFFTERFGNASSMHDFGASVGKALKAARLELVELLGAERDSEVIFTSGGTESDTSAIWSALEAQPGRNEIVTTTVEHPAILSVCKWLEKNRGVKVHYTPVDRSGRLDIGFFRDALNERTALATVMWANNETGTLFPVVELADLAREKGVLFHTDAVQAVGKIPMDLKNSSIGMLSLSAHKLHGPKGIGALYVRRDVRFKPLIRGGHQERDRRAGTENAPGIVGLGEAARLARLTLAEDATRIAALRDRLETGILAQVGHCAVMGDPLARLPNTTNIAFEFVEGEAVLLLLNREGIAASAGSACTSGSLEPSHVMRAMEIPFTAAHGTIRFSLSRDTTIGDVDKVVATIPGIVARLREVSPYWKGGSPASTFEPVYA